MRMTVWFTYNSGYFINCLLLPSPQKLVLVLLMREELNLQRGNSSSRNGKNLPSLAP